MRSIAFASVTVPTVERAFAPIRSWSTMIAVVSPSSTSTSGRARDGMNPCTNELYVSLIIRCDSAAIVPKTSELLPEPDTPVNTVRRRLGISTLTSWRLFTRAPWTRIRSCVSAVAVIAITVGWGRRRTQRARPNLRILTALTYYWPHWTGLTKTAQLVAEGLAKRGHQVTVVAGKHERSLPARESINGVDVVRVASVARVSRGLVMPGFGPAVLKQAARHDV